MNSEKILKSLVQNYNFKEVSSKRLPTINFVYPDFTADGNTEDFRFSSTLRRELREREYLVREALKDKSLVWTNNKSTLEEIDPIAPRLGIGDLISERINSVYSGYAPLLFVGANDKSFESYVVKPVVDGSMAWFELTPKERCSVENLLVQKAEARPYQTFIQRILGGKSK